METTNYPEIQALKTLFTNYKVSIKVSDIDFLAGKKNYPAVDLFLAGRPLRLYVEDEYQDLQLNNPTLAFCLVLRELENYQEEEDYLTWCSAQLLDPVNPQVRAYYMDLGNIYRTVEKILGTIDSQISDYDFGLNAGAVQELRRTS